MQMTMAPQDTCSHEKCDMEPCTAFDFATYEQDSVWGWGTTCDRCEAFIPGMLPEAHVEARHEDAL